MSENPVPEGYVVTGSWRGNYWPLMLAKAMSVGKKPILALLHGQATMFRSRASATRAINRTRQMRKNPRANVAERLLSAEAPFQVVALRREGE